MSAHSADSLLHRYRAQFSERATDWIAARADEYGATIATREQRWLRAARAVLGDPLDGPSIDAVRQAGLLVEARDEAKRLKHGIEAEATLRFVAAEAERMREQGMGPERALERAARVLALEARIEDPSVVTGRDAWDPKVADPLNPYIDAFGPVAAAQLLGGVRERAAEGPGRLTSRRVGDSRARIEMARFGDGIGLATMREQRLRKEGLEARIVECEARFEQLRATGYRREIARTLQRDLDNARAEVASIDRWQRDVWDGRSQETEIWMNAYRRDAEESLAVEYEVLSEVEQGLRSRGREVVPRETPELQAPAPEPPAPDFGAGF